MKKKLLSILALIIVVSAVFAGCDSGLEARVDSLDGQLAQLQARVDTLEAENAALKAQLESAAIPETEAPVSETDREPSAELTILDWNFEEDMLIVNGVFARVMNLAKAGEAVPEVESSTVALYRNGTQIYYENFELLPGEASDSYERDLEFFGYELSDLSEGDQLELLLEVTLSDGTSLTAWGGSWDYVNGQLLLTVG